MYFVTLLIGTILLLFFAWQLEATKACYKAKTCVHDTVEKCGIDEDGTPRRFLDTCDMLEYNCYYNTSYTKATKSECFGLPPIEKDEKT